jgi:Tfp pilus assembly protein PilZ
MRIRVRTVWGVSEIAQTRDVSKAGLGFLSNQRYQVDDEVYITLPFVDRQVPVETKAKIIWTLEASVGRLYGVCYVK